MMSSGLMDTGLVQLTAERIPITGSNYVLADYIRQSKLA